MQTPPHGRLWRVLVILLAVAVSGAAQAPARDRAVGTSESAAGAAQPQTAAAHAGVHVHTGSPLSTEPVAEAAHADAAAPAGAADLAIRFEALLGQHSVLAADLMRSRIRGDDDFVQAANAALGKNTDAMTALMTQMFGASVANQFRPMWAEHIVALFAYADALAARDEAARARARKELIEYEEDLANFFAGASHGRLSTAAARAAVVQHVKHLTTQADAYAAGNYTDADRAYRTATSTRTTWAWPWPTRCCPAAQRATLRQPIWRLRSQLGKLLAEHAVLIEDVTRAAVTNTPDFAASGQSINGNTNDLAAAMDVLFGASAAKQFQSLWASHVENLVAYASVRRRPAPRSGRSRPATGLGDFEARMAAFLARRRPTG